ncbi:chemotaxis protein CheA [Proteiniclasticum sp. SCR006]|uniref:Chemotaxis protein CheA n=1 Tax=Proteiniclasticum aestuarii TaxID=2817862 RepID=A0A939HD32_9CLOT|nr:chemotaxis protein CheA [Proteiniclasticum aestuarii]MBO1265340.1 chemotaxis protein CheA [Proteiniclasticum aestuarii]
MDDTQKYRDLFFEETDEYLQSLNDNLLVLEKDTESPGIIDEIFRSAHTLKGMAATMGYTTMTELTHNMENVLEQFRQGSLKVTSDVVSVIFKCLDKLSEIVEDLRDDHYPDYDITDLLEELKNLSGKKEDGSKTDEETGKTESETFDAVSDIDASIIRQAMDKGYRAYSIMVKVTKSCMLKGARAYLVVNKLEQSGEILETSPGVEDLEEGNYEEIFKLLYLSQKGPEAVRETIENVAEIEEVEMKEISEEDLQHAYLISTEKTEEKNTETRVSGEQKENSKNRAEEKHGTAAHASQSIRVDLSRLDNFMNLVSELVIYRTRLEELSTQYKATEINEPLEQVARITSDLQDLVLKIRMQPVNVVFNRFPRMIRDLTQELGKDMDLVIEGEETELDRTVVSELGEPLVHLIRNAADHGIESREERIASGKNPKGIIELIAYQEGNKVVIKVSDDGKGIDPEKIRESAERKGIPTEGLDKNELIQLIFNQGFSTNTEVTNISGRGVGMDVVRSKITSLGGNIEVDSVIGKGTSFVIKLPLTLSIIQALMVHVSQETFALPLGLIEKVVKVNEGDVKDSHNGEVYIYREKVIPVIRINEKLSLPMDTSNQHIIMVNIGGKQYGLLVDELIGQQEIVIKKLSGSVGKMNEYLGAAILGNGDITLILDVGNLVSGKGETA